VIRLENLTRHYGDVVAVRGVSVEIGRGEIVGLLGHNGAGKTTVMKMLTGYLEPTSGRATIDGHDVVTERLSAQAKLGYLPENAPLYLEMHVHEYLTMMADLRGLPPDRHVAAVWNAARQTGLTAHLDRPIASLSKGYKQRVGIAQAILHEPDVLVLDEPTNGLDPTQIQSIRELIKSLGRRTTVILSTHILQEVEAVCDRVLVMIDGDLAADSRLADLLGSADLRVVLSDGDGAARLAAVPGVAAVEDAGSPAPGRRAYRVRSAGADVAADVVAAVTAAGLRVHEITRVQRTLQQVFEELQAAHASRAAKKEVA
jgi:ABC-2 type transport system ATP-binding protein